MHRLIVLDFLEGAAPARRKKAENNWLKLAPREHNASFTCLF